MDALRDDAPKSPTGDTRRAGVPYERAFLLMFTAQDAAGKRYDVVTSANLDISIGGTSITASWPNSPQNPAPCPFALAGMSGARWSTPR